MTSADDFDDDLDLPGMWERADFTGGAPDLVIGSDEPATQPNPTDEETA